LVELAAFVVYAVLVEKRSVREVAAAHGVSKTWLYELLARYREGGEAALQVRSRRPRHSPSQIPLELEEEIVEVRKEILDAGFEAGPVTILTHLERRHNDRGPCSVSTIWRVLSRRGFITPEPHKRPKSSYVRFQANLPNERWQTDMTHVTLRSGRVVEVVNVIDDHSRLCVASRVFSVTTAGDVVATFYWAAARFGFPASVLSDNGRIFTASSGGDRGALATELARLGIVFKHSRPYHPQTCGKVERFHQTMKKHLGTGKAPRSIAELQARLDAFAAYYNEVRPHRALGRRTPSAAFEARVKAGPSGQPVRNAGEFRIRYDRVDNDGKVTLRYGGKLRHLAVGRPHKRTYVMLLVDDRDVRVLCAEGTGELLATFRIDPDRTYQPRLRPEMSAIS
jgi:transposase InsO family protein